MVSKAKNYMGTRRHIFIGSRIKWCSTPTLDKSIFKSGLGNIVLYESNGYYCVDFEAVNYNLNLEENAIFCKGDIEFGNEYNLFRYEQEFIKHITRKE